MTQDRNGPPLYCLACGRRKGPGSNEVETVHYLETEWCAQCAKVKRIPGYPIVVSQPSPGRMSEDPTPHPIDVWVDCFEMKPKGRIKVADAKVAIAHSWRSWSGDKSTREAMLLFFAWLKRHHPYLLTFRKRGDPWQHVHSWLLQAERGDL